MSIKDLMATIAQKYDVQCSGSSIEEIAKLQELGFPKEAIEFYSKHGPSKTINGEVRIDAARSAIEENTNLIPGVYTCKHGYYVFGSTCCGDVYCFNVNMVDESGDPEIVLLSHEVIGEDTSPAEIAELAKPVAENLSEFLEKFLNDEVDEDSI